MVEINPEAKRRKIFSDLTGGSMNPLPEGEEEETTPKKPKLGEFESSTQECIIFYLVHSEEDMESAEGFHPEFTHQHFGEKEIIYGYKDLRVSIWMHASTFLTYIDISFSGKVTGRRKKADDILPILKEHFPAGFTQNRKTFVEQLKAGGGTNDLIKLVQEKGQVVEKWQWDELLSQESNEGEPETSPGSAKCEVLHVDLKDKTINKWHARLQPLVPFFIDNGQQIDSQDPSWELFIAVEQGDEGKTEPSWTSIVGFCVVYRFYHHPESTRLRISQVVVLPPYQGRGHGFHMLQAVNSFAIREKCYDLTVEDPSDELQLIRETIDILRLLTFPPALSAAKAVSADNSEGEVLSSTELNGRVLSGNGTHVVGSQSQFGVVQKWGSISKQLLEKIREELKMNEKQIMKCWEVLLLLFIPEGPLGEAKRKQWCAMVQRRLYSEELGGKNDEEAAKHKRIIDIDFVHNDKRMFFMTKVKNANTGNNEGNGELETEGAEVVKESLSVEERRAVLKEGFRKFFEDRISQVDVIMEKVRRHGKQLLSSLTVSH